MRGSEAAASLRDMCSSDGEGDDEGGSVDGKGQNTIETGSGKKVRRTAQAVQLEQGQKLLRTLCDDWSWQEHWEARTRKRDIEAFMNKLLMSGRRLTGMKSSDEAVNAGNKLLRGQEQLEKRQGMFMILRDSFLEVLKNPLSQDMADCLAEAPAEALGNVVTVFTTTTFNKKTLDDEFLRVLPRLLSTASAPGFLTLGLIKDPDQAAVVQTNIVLTIAERVAKEKQRSVVTDCLLHLWNGLVKAGPDVDARGKEWLSNGWMSRALAQPQKPGNYKIYSATQKRTPSLPEHTP